MVLKRTYAPVDVEEHEEDADKPELGRFPLRIPIDTSGDVCGEQLGVVLPVLSFVSLSNELLRFLFLFLFLRLFFLFMLLAFAIGRFLELQRTLNH